MGDVLALRVWGRRSRAGTMGVAVPWLSWGVAAPAEAVMLLLFVRRTERERLHRLDDG